MKKILLSLILLFQFNFLFSQKCKPEIVKYVDFLKMQNVSAKDYVLNLFKTHDIVVICERHHGEMTQYKLFLDIISSNYFIKNVGNVFTEIGAVDNRQNVLDFIKTNFKTEKEKQNQQISVYRQMSFPYWEKTNFFNFIGNLNTLNSKLKKQDQINLFVSDNRNPTDNETNSPELFAKYFKENWNQDRDSIMAYNIITTIDSLHKYSYRKKCLVIMNYRHAFSKKLRHDNNVGAILFQKYKDKFANVYLNSVAPTQQVAKSDTAKAKIFQNMSEVPIQDGKWDAAYRMSKKENVGFNFRNSPFGKDNFDIWSPDPKKYTYSDIFTGFIFYLPLEKHIESFGIPNFFDNGYLDKMYDKWKIFYTNLNEQPPTKKEISEDGKITIEKYDDFDLMQKIIAKWIE